MSLIEKIDARISVYKEKQSNSDYAGSIAYQNIINGLNDAKQIILSEQKESCKYCENEILTVKMEFGYDSYMGKDGWVSSTRHPKVCPMCGRPLNQPYTE